jgi:hypothetical protein
MFTMRHSTYDFPMSDLKPPIFLLGNVRSGTSMLWRFFEQHPEVKAWYEPRTVWMYADPGRAYDRFDERDATPRVVNYIRKRFLKFQRKHGNLRIMEKTPSNMLRIPYVRAIFPESKFAYIIRDPLANLSSSELKWQKPIAGRRLRRQFFNTPKTQLPYYMWRMFSDHFRTKVLGQRYVSMWGVRYPGIYEDRRRLTVEQIIAKQWVACAEQGEKDLGQIDADLVLRLRYEEFVEDPVAQFERLLRHFELSMTKDLEVSIREQVDPNRRQKWKRLDEDVIAACLPILSEPMQRFGYPMPEEFARYAHASEKNEDAASPRAIA